MVATPLMARTACSWRWTPSATWPKAGLVDQLHVAIAPILLGRGIRLWDDLRGFESGYAVNTDAAVKAAS